MTFLFDEHSRSGPVLNRLYACLEAQVRRRRQYRQLDAEIETSAQADLMELGAFQIDLHPAACEGVFG